MDNQVVRRYVEEFYENAKRGLLSHKEVQKIYNLEIFVKALQQKEKK